MSIVRMSIPIVAAALALVGNSASAEEPVWQAMLGDLPKTEKAGFGGLCGICVDHATGTVVVNISDRGFYRSTDAAKTFKRMSDTQPKGRTEEPGCLLIDPTGKTKTLLTALVYGAPIGASSDEGATWKTMNGKSSHIDWCAVDWTDPDRKFVLALKHESGGTLIVSRDGGASFSEIGKGYGTGWVFNATTAVVAEAKTKDRPKPNLMRTTDAGQTWKSCGAYSPVGVNSAQALPKSYDGSLYWLVDGGLIATNDAGETWKKVCDLKNARYGPIFGKDARHMFVLTAGGILETTDGGTAWSKPITVPKDLRGTGGPTWLEYDPTSDAIYIMKMGSDLFKLSRAK